MTTFPQPWSLQPAAEEPQTGEEIGAEIPDDIHWSLSFGFALNVDHSGDDPASPLTFTAHFSDADLARGFVKREVTPEQLERFALLLLAKTARYRQTKAGRQ